MSAGKTTKRKNQSIYENSTLIAANLVRASSIALVEMAVGSPSGRSARPADVGPTMTSMRPVKSGTRSTGSVMEPAGWNNVDKRAAEYILKVRQRNQSDGGAAPSSNSRIPLPPSKKWVTDAR